MPSDFEEIVSNFRLADALDLGVATVLFGLMFYWLQKKSNQALLLVILGMAALYAVSQWLRMYLTLGLFRIGLSVAVIGVFIIFQNDLRHAFERLAAWHPFSRRNGSPPTEPFLTTLMDALALLAKEKIGALIVLPARQNLERHLHGGEKLDGRISVPLLHSLFHSDSSGHDGAVILEDKRIARFGVHLPLSTNLQAIGPGGTRHAAALGLAEQSDALVIVVSEERGTISLAEDGQIQIVSEPLELADRLRDFYQQESRPQTWGQRLGLVGEPLLAAGLGFVAAFLLWWMFAFQVDSVQRVVDLVPVETHQLPKDWVIESLSPEQLQVNVAGSQRAFAAFDWNTLRVALDLSEPVEGRQTLVVGEDSMKLPEEITLLRAEPSIVRITAYKTQTVKRPIEVKMHGQLPDDWELESAQAALPNIAVRVRESLLTKIESIPTEFIDLSQIEATTTREIPLVLPEGVWPSEDMPTNVKVKLQLKRKQPPAEKPGS